MNSSVKTDSLSVESRVPNFTNAKQEC